MKSKISPQKLQEIVKNATLNMCISDLKIEADENLIFNIYFDDNLTIQFKSCDFNNVTFIGGTNNDLNFESCSFGINSSRFFNFENSHLNFTTSVAFNYDLRFKNLRSSEINLSHLKIPDLDKTARVRFPFHSVLIEYCSNCDVSISNIKQKINLQVWNSSFNTSYFQNSKHQSAKNISMIKRIADIEWIVVRTEVEALLTEANLIKKHQPHYNINLRDDKSFPYIRITKEPYPRVFITREIIRDGSKYFGPYTDVRHLRRSLKAVHRIFPVRSCDYFIDDKSIKDKKVSLCLDYHIKKCDGPCEAWSMKKIIMI